MTIFLEEFMGKGTRKAREIVRANILLLADEGYKTEAISDVVRVHRQSVWRVKKRYLEEGLMSALRDKPRPGQPRKYTGRHDAEIIALACSSPPRDGRRWTIQLLVEEARKKPGLETLNRESVRLVLKKNTG